MVERNQNIPNQRYARQGLFREFLKELFLN
jgi:hypothetical protein